MLQTNKLECFFLDSLLFVIKHHVDLHLSRLIPIWWLLSKHKCYITFPIVTDSSDK
jgi:hypothetical protein